ncbi:Hypothetical protein PHPALM_17074 [Phytophthora palmivora]|uniref:Man1/Src1 C-terminal domain-containing protein n=1 Tax=Phytophthora palmivora TaxID=4796 RepID=A0A2P4XNA6_9STRA|nr:Hypothetical protein PHPALM_17074 [Phytophthora palmivora]
MDKSIRKRKPSSSVPSNSKRRRQEAPIPASASTPHKPRPKLSTRRPAVGPRTTREKPKEKKKKVKAVEQLTLFSRYADPLVQSPKQFYQVSEVAHVSEFNPTGATLLETPPSRSHRQETEAIAIPLTTNGGAPGTVDLTGVKHVGDLEMVEGDGIFETLMRSTTPRVQRRFPSEEALTESEQRDREVLRRRRLKLRSQYSSMKTSSQELRDGDCGIMQSPEIERNLFQPVKLEEPKVTAQNEVTEEDEERAQLEEEEAETDEETTESKINRLSKVMHMNWRQFILWLVSGAFLLCALVVTAPFVKKLLEPPLPYCDSEWIEVNDGSFVLADPADFFDRSKALQPFIATTALDDRISRSACQPCPVYGNCLNGSVISCAPPYVLQYGLCKENPEVQENLDRLAIIIRKFVVKKAASKACDNVSLWNYLSLDGSMNPTNDLTASIEVLLSDVQAFVTRTISLGKAMSVLPREYVFSRALDMALRDLNDIFVTVDQRQLIVGERCVTKI